MKICLCNDRTQQDSNAEEIEINKIVSKYGADDIFVKMYGSISFNKKDNKIMILYDDLLTGNQMFIDYTKSIYVIKDPCEKYLFLEKGYRDLFDSKFTDFFTDYVVDNFLNLFNAYKINEKLVIEKNKFFLINDIKSENIMVMSDSMDSKFKLIDFGLSKQSKDFFYQDFLGTQALLNYLYYPYKVTDNFIFSPLFDLFCIHCTFMEFILNTEIKFYQKFYKKDIDYINLLTKCFNKYKSYKKEQKLKFAKILVIGLVIKDFYLNNIINLDDKNDANKNHVLKNLKLQQNMKLFEYNIILTPSAPIPEKYSGEQSNQNDYTYLDKIIQCILNCTNIQINEI
jgi:serine/threonine protein kinase